MHSMKRRWNKNPNFDLINFKIRFVKIINKQPVAMTISEKDVHWHEAATVNVWWALHVHRDIKHGVILYFVRHH